MTKVHCDEKSRVLFSWDYVYIYSFKKSALTVMEIKTIKELYEAPSTTVIEVRQEGMICTSGGEYPEWPGESI